MNRSVRLNGPLVLTGQGYEHTRVENLTPAGGGTSHKVRVVAHIDTFYDRQSYAKTELWDGTKWNQVLYWTGGDPALKLPHVVASVPKTLAAAETAMAALVTQMIKDTSRVLW